MGFESPVEFIINQFTKTQSEVNSRDKKTTEDTEGTEKETTDISALDGIDADIKNI
jgi:hypothetical protein